MKIINKLFATVALASLSVAGIANAEDVTVKYLTFSAAPNYIKELDATIAAFEAINPDIHIEYETAGWEAYFTKLQTLVASGKAPDTYELNHENFVTYASKGALLDIGGMLGADKSIYNATALDVFTHDGKQFGLVESFSNVVMFYNQDMFDAAGVDYPAESWTWKEELSAAQSLTKDGNWGAFAPIQFWEFYKTIAQNGGAILNDDKTQVVIDSAQNIETLQWMIDKINKYKVTPSNAQMAGQSSEDMFKAGKIGMLRTGIWMFGAFNDASFKWDISLEPGNTNKAHHFFANGVVVSDKSEHPEQSFKWIKFLTSSQEAVELRIAAGWELPAVADPAYAKAYLDQPIPPSREVVFKALDSAVVPPVIANWNQLTDAVGKELEAAVLGTKTAEQALKDAKTAIEAIM